MPPALANASTGKFVFSRATRETGGVIALAPTTKEVALVKPLALERTASTEKPIFQAAIRRGERRLVM